MTFTVNADLEVNGSINQYGNPVGGSSGVTNSAGENVIPKSDGANLVASKLSDNGTNVIVSGGFLPDAAGARPLGSSGLAFSELYIGGSATARHRLLSGGGTTLKTWTLPNASLTGVGSVGLLANGSIPYISTSTNTLSPTSLTFDGAQVICGGNIIFGPGDNNGNIGAAGANRPARLFLGTGLNIEATITPPATTGAQAIDKTAGSVNFAATETSLVVTCDKCTENSIVMATVATNDATLKSVQAVAANGFFTLHGNAAATAETRVNFWILN